jgi:hypothetical protein
MRPWSAGASHARGVVPVVQQRFGRSRSGTSNRGVRPSMQSRRMPPRRRPQGDRRSAAGASFIGGRRGNAAAPRTPQSVTRHSESSPSVLRPSARDRMIAKATPDMNPNRSPIQATGNDSSPGSMLAGSSTPMIRPIVTNSVAQAVPQSNPIPMVPRSLRRMGVIVWDPPDRGGCRRRARDRALRRDLRR